MYNSGLCLLSNLWEFGSLRPCLCAHRILSSPSHNWPHPKPMSTVTQTWPNTDQTCRMPWQVGGNCPNLVEAKPSLSIQRRMWPSVSQFGRIDPDVVGVMTKLVYVEALGTSLGVGFPADIG